MNLFFITIIAFIPALMWFFLWRVQDKEKEPLKAMLWCFFLGIFAAVPFFVIQNFGFMENYESSSLLIFGLAFLEEAMKALMMVIGIEISRHWFTQIVDGLIYGSAVALGFSFSENIFYLFNWFTVSGLGQDLSFTFVYLVRSFDTMLGHTLFTALFGFFYASAYLRNEIFPKDKKVKPWAKLLSGIWKSITFHVTMFHILPNRPSGHGHYPVNLIMEGILIASFSHAVFNLFLNQNIAGTQLGFLTVPLVFLLSYLLWRMFMQGVYVKIVRRVKGA